MSKMFSDSRLRILEDERRSQGWTRTHFCHLAGVSAPTYRALVQGRGSIRSLIALMPLLDLTWGWVEDDEDANAALARLRKARNLTQSDMAMRLGCSRATVIALERRLSGSVERLLEVLTVLRAPAPLRSIRRTASNVRALVPRTNDPIQDRVMTPRPFARAVIDHFHDDIDGDILDPCAGDGAFFDQLPRHLPRHWCEVERGRDFFHWSQPVDWIITNPPWSRLRPFTLHAMSLAENIVFVAPLTNFTTKARLRDLKEHGFGMREILMLPTPREWPQSGFQVVAAHLQRGYTGSWKMSEFAEVPA